MPYFKWTDDLKTGSQVIDYQHKRLISLVNDLHDIQENEDFKEDLIEVVIEELKQYAKFHFETEEKFLDKIKHENIADHKKLHRTFEVKLDELLSQRNRYDELGKEIFTYLKNWLEYHIKVEDKGMMETHLSGVGLI